jgi:hypothetical protein
MFGDFVDRTYPVELEIKDTTDTKITNMLSIKNSSMLMISVSDNFLVGSVGFFF